jgi:5-methylcytosine-specific restriction endonuclease McrA
MSQWGFNLRSELRPRDWDRVRKDTYAAAGYRCELCGGVGRKHPVEAHERWSYDDVNHVQTLVGLIALCPSCHMVKHFGLAVKNGNEARARKHLGKVNGWNPEQVEQHLQDSFQTWRERSRHAWALDIRWITRGTERP